MSQFYKILKADPLGEPYTPNFAGAKATQSYWCQVEGQEKDVMVGKQVRDDGQPALLPGQHIYGDLLLATSQKGNEYLKFKSAKVPDGVQWPADSVTVSASTPAVVGGDMPGWFKPVFNLLEDMDKRLKRLEGVEEEEPLPIIPDPADEPLTEEEQMEIDKLFGKD